MSSKTFDSDSGDGPSGQQNCTNNSFSEFEAQAASSIASLPMMEQPFPKHSLNYLLMERLHDCGWYDEVRRMIRGLLKKRGPHNVTYSEINTLILPRARRLVPEELRNEIQLRVRLALESTHQ